MAKRRFLSFAAAVLAAAMLLTLTGCSTIADTFNNLKAKVASPKEYFTYVEEKSVKDFSDTLTALYGNWVQNTLANDHKYNVKLRLGLSDEVLGGMADSIGNGMDTSWLQDTNFDLTLNAVDGKTSADLLFGIGGEHVLTVSLTTGADQGLLVGLKEITDDLMKFSAGGEQLGALSGGEKQRAAQAMPEAPAVCDLVAKYHGMILSGIEEVEKGSEEVTAEDVTQTLSVLTCTVPQETAKNIGLNVLRSIKEDTDIKAIIENAQILLENAAETDAYGSFLAQIDAQIEQLEAEQPGEDGTVTIYDYVNDKDEIVGRRIVQNGEDVLSYVTVEDGKQFAAKADFKGGLSIRESGTKEGGRVTSDRYISRDGVTISKTTFTDFDREALKSGVIDGKIRFYPDASAIEEAAGDASALVDAACELEMKGDWNTGTFTLSVFNGDAPLFTATEGVYTVADAETVSEPAGKQVEISGLDSLQELMVDMHLEPLVENLRKTSVPKEYVDAIDELAQQLAQY